MAIAVGCNAFLGIPDGTPRSDGGNPEGGMCPSAQILCQEACTDITTSLAHCGGCQAPCGPQGEGEEARCVGGQCVHCPSPGVFCGNACVDLSVDPGNCGACGRSCRGQACAQGRCAPEALVVGLRSAVSVTRAGDRTYWTGSVGSDSTSIYGVHADGDPLCAAPSTTCSRTEVVDPSPDVPPMIVRRIVVSPTALFGLANQGVVRFRDGLAQRDRVVAAERIDMFSYFADEQRVCWVQPTGLRCLPEGSSTPILVAGVGDDTDAEAFAVSGTDAYLAVSGQVLSGPSVLRVALGSGCELQDCPVVFRNAEHIPKAVATGSGALVVTTQGGVILEQPLAESCTGEPCATRLAQIPFGERLYDRVAVDDRFVYWVERHSVRRTPRGVPCDDSTCERMLVDAAQINDIAVDEKYLYVAMIDNDTLAPGRVVRIAK